MPKNDEPDLFQDERQGDMFGYDAPPAYTPDPERVRRRLHRILAEVRESQTLPWDSATLSLYRTIFPQMTGCLPEEEGAQLRFEFEEQLERLEAA